MRSSGRKQKFGTGAHRDAQKGKGRFDLIPPTALKRLAQWYQQGADKYGPRNWEKGMPVSRYFSSAVSHLFAHLGGDREEDNMAAVLWNVMAIMHTEEMVRRGVLPKELVDWPDHGSPVKPSAELTRIANEWLTDSSALTPKERETLRRHPNGDAGLVLRLLDMTEPRTRTKGKKKRVRRGRAG